MKNSMVTPTVKPAGRVKLDDKVTFVVRVKSEEMVNPAGNTKLEGRVYPKGVMIASELLYSFFLVMSFPLSESLDKKHFPSQVELIGITKPAPQKPSNRQSSRLSGIFAHSSLVQQYSCQFSVKVIVLFPQ